MMLSLTGLPLHINLECKTGKYVRIPGFVIPKLDQFHFFLMTFIIFANLSSSPK